MCPGLGGTVEWRQKQSTTTWKRMQIYANGTEPGMLITVEKAEDVWIKLLDAVVLLEESWTGQEADASTPQSWGGEWTTTGSGSGSGDKLNRILNLLSTSRSDASSGSIARGKRGGVSDPSSGLSSPSGVSPCKWMNCSLIKAPFRRIQMSSIQLLGGGKNWGGEVAASQKDRSRQDWYSVHVAASVWMTPKYSGCVVGVCFRMAASESVIVAASFRLVTSLIESNSVGFNSISSDCSLVDG